MRDLSRQARGRARKGREGRDRLGQRRQDRELSHGLVRVARRPVAVDAARTQRVAKRAMTVAFGQWTIGLDDEGLALARADRRQGVVRRADAVARPQRAAGLRRHDRRPARRFSSTGAEPPGLDAQIDAADRLARGKDRAQLRTRAASVARVGPFRRAGLDAGHDGHRAQPRHERRDGGGARRRMRRSRLRAQHAPALSRSLCPYRAALDGAGVRRGEEPRRVARGDCRGLRRGAFRERRASNCARPFAPSSSRGTRAARAAIASITISPTISAPPSRCRRWSSATSTRARAPASCSRAIRRRGAREPYGEYLPRAQGEDVVSGKFTPEAACGARRQELPEALAEPSVGRAQAGAGWARRAGHRIHRRARAGSISCNRDAAKLAPHAAAHIAVDLAREGLIDERAAVLRVTPDQVRILLSPAYPRETPCKARSFWPPARPLRPASASASS